MISNNEESMKNSPSKPKFTPRLPTIIPGLTKSQSVDMTKEDTEKADKGSIAVKSEASSSINKNKDDNVSEKVGTTPTDLIDITDSTPPPLIRLSSTATMKGLPKAMDSKPLNNKTNVIDCSISTPKQSQREVIDLCLSSDESAAENEESKKPIDPLAIGDKECGGAKTSLPSSDKEDKPN